MRLLSNTRLIFAVLMVCSSASLAQNPIVKRDIVWPQPESEISSPRFSPDGNFVVLVTRVHWPDGAEAEGLPESFFKGLEARKARDPRFADPVIKLVDLSGRSVCEVRYGANPSVSPDNKRIAFSRQKKPITGLRSLADTLDGNDTQIFDCEAKQTLTVAEPISGYLDDPVFLSDGESIVYTTNEATNGAMSGPVGIVRVETASRHQEPLLTKETTAAVPCDSVRNKSQFQAFMCEQRIKLPKSFPNLLEKFELSDQKVIALQARPIPSAGDMYMADRYELALISAFPVKDILLPLGEFETENLRQVSFQALTKNRLMILSGYWKSFSLDSKSWLPQTGPQNTIPGSFYSPSGKYYLAAEPLEQPDHLTLIRAADGEKMFVSPVVDGIYGITWSPNSMRFAVVTLTKGRTGAAYREELTIYSLH
jgi:hypothetical protein